MMFSRMSDTALAGQWVLLTGASGGIGSAIAQRLARAGARVIVVGRAQGSLQTLLRKIQVYSKGSFAICADINQREGRELIRNQVLALGQPLDVLIHSAGVNDFALLADTEEAQLTRVINTNLLSPILLTRLLLPLLNPAGARVLMVGSGFGYLGYPGFSSYCASKFGLRGFSEALRRELGDSNTQVAYLAPRATNTSLNSDAINALNQALGNHSDEPALVAAAALRMLRAKHMADTRLGWPERLFLRLNQWFPALVDRALGGQLAQIKHYARRAAGVAAPVAGHSAGNRPKPDPINPSSVHPSVHQREV